MQKSKSVLFTLSDETVRTLNILSENNKINKSKMVRYVLRYFDQYPYKLRNVLEEVKINLEEKKIQKNWMDKIHEEIKEQQQKLEEKIKEYENGRGT